MKVLNNVKVLQGDGVDLKQIERILKFVTNSGYAPENIVFGSGGALLQKVNRDTYKFAMKASAVLTTENKWEDIYKDPITDPGKRSKSGRFDNIKTTVYHNGELINETDFERIRKLSLSEY
jgi:nicotinamide phosphoribosyltransferase